MEKKAKIISVYLPRGGVGKTTTAVNLSASFALLEYKTLLIDLDPFGSSAVALGFTPNKVKAGIVDIFSHTRSIAYAIHKTELDFLGFIPSNINNIQLDDIFTQKTQNRIILKNSIESIRKSYDFIILDCPPILHGITINALTASDSILIPFKCGHITLDAVDRFFNYYNRIKETSNTKLSIEGIVITMYEKDAYVTIISEKELKLKYRKYLLDTVIPVSNLLNQATFYGKPLCLHKIDSYGAIAYLNLAQEIISKQKENIND